MTVNTAPSPEQIMKASLSLLLNKYIYAAKPRSTHDQRLMAILACGSVVTLCLSWEARQLVDHTQRLGLEALARDMCCTLTGLKKASTFQKVTTERLDWLRHFLMD